MKNYSDIMLSARTVASAGNIRRVNYLRALRSCDKSKAFLEIGPGNGEFLPVAKEAGFERIFAVDIDQGVIERTVSRYPYVNAQLVGAGQNLSEMFASGQFSCVAACHVLEHIHEDQRLRYLEQCGRLLAGNGILLIELPNPLCPFGGLASYLADPTHRLPISSKGMENMLKMVGLTVVATHSVRPPISLSHFMGWVRYALVTSVGAVLNVLGRSDAVRSPSFYVIAKRE